MIAVLNWAAAHWFLIFLLWGLGLFEGVRDFFVGIWKDVTGVRHKRRMKELKARERIARAARHAEAAALPKPGPCVHRDVIAVVSKADEVVAWLCKACKDQLPANWAVRVEDL